MELVAIVDGTGAFPACDHQLPTGVQNTGPFLEYRASFFGIDMVDGEKTQNGG